MSAQQMAKAVFNELAVHEAVLCDYYEACLDLYPAHREFWESLRQQQRAHADLFRLFMPAIADGRMTMSPDHLNLDVLRAFRVYTQQQYRWLAEHAPPMDYAVAIAVELERTILDEGFLSGFETDTPYLRQMLLELMYRTHLHAQQLTELKGQASQLVLAQKAA